MPKEGEKRRLPGKARLVQEQEADDRQRADEKETRWAGELLRDRSFDIHGNSNQDQPRHLIINANPIHGSR